MGERVRLGKRAVEAMPAVSILWDAEVSGFGARRQRGAAVAYLLKTRSTSGRQVFLTIGRHGSPWTPDTARAEARRLLQVIAEGRDPSAERRQAGKRLPSPPWRRDSSMTSRSAENTDLRDILVYERHIRPTFASFKLAELSRARIAEWHHARVNTPVEANRALAVFKRMLNLARRWGLHDGENPATAVEMFHEKPRDRVGSGDELARIGRAMVALPVPPSARAIVARHHRRPVGRDLPIAVGGRRLPARTATLRGHARITPTTFSALHPGCGGSRACCGRGFVCPH